MSLRLRVFLVALLAVFAVVTVAGCSDNAPDKSQKDAIKSAKERSENRQIFRPTHDVDFNNYNSRMRLADSPATILWCTFFPPGVQGVSNASTPGQAITVPIAGKLTDAGVTPFPPASPALPDSDGDGTWYPFPAPDGMYGTAGDYRFGFDPTRAIYYEFTDLASFCTTEPTVFQSQDTRLVIDTDSSLASLTRAAEDALRKGDADRALEILKGAER
jgi:hypothetical protein